MVCELKRKLQEEVAEFNEADDVEELVDILEVVYALANDKGLSQY
jgi:predicted house-cleaning noncanonical NTP pyrophosphatase (MazG superfamily)